jgi:hypothetical protein
VDLNSDGQLDVLTTREVAFGRGGTEFVPVQPLPLPSNSVLRQPTDFDADGRLDLVWNLLRPPSAILQVQLRE